MDYGSVASTRAAIASTWSADEHMMYDKAASPAVIHAVCHQALGHPARAVATTNSEVRKDTSLAINICPRCPSVAEVL